MEQRPEPLSTCDPQGRSPRGWWRRLHRTTRYWYLRVLRQKSSPRNLAMAMGLGMFIGALPIIPFQSIVVIALAFVLRVNKLTAWLATCYSNAFTMVPFYYFLFVVGKTVLPFEGVRFDPADLTMEGLIHTGWKTFSVMMAGGLLFGIPAAIITYLLSLMIIRRHRRRKAARMLRRRLQRAAKA